LASKSSNNSLPLAIATCTTLSLSRRRHIVYAAASHKPRATTHLHLGVSSAGRFGIRRYSRVLY
jgi:hypothetical protein